MRGTKSFDRAYSIHSIKSIDNTVEIEMDAVEEYNPTRFSFDIFVYFAHIRAC